MRDCDAKGNMTNTGLEKRRPTNEEGLPVVLLHGTSGQSEDWSQVVEQLTSHRPKRPSDGTAPEMSQPTSIQMLDTAIWKKLGVEEVTESEAFYHALATLLSGGYWPARNIPKWRPSNFSQRSAPTLPNQNVSCEPSVDADAKPADEKLGFGLAELCRRILEQEFEHSRPE